MKLRYKIVSYSSQDQNYPITNLLTENLHWQSSRFCEFPQHITIMFYEPIKIETIILTAHSFKIPTRINFLYSLTNNDQDYQKMGYINFGDNESTGFKGRQKKKINKINIQTKYFKLLIAKNYINKYNFFNQVAINQLIFQGAGYDYTLPAMRISQVQTGSKGEFVESKLAILTQFKQRFVRQQQFGQAKKVKQVISTVKKIAAALQKAQSIKSEAVKEENFDKAKKLKKDTDKLKNQITNILNNFYDPVQKTIKSVNSQSSLTKLLQTFGQKQLHRSQGPSGSRVTNNSKKQKILQQQQQNKSEQQQSSKDQDDNKQSRIKYQDRILPALLNKKKPIDTSQFVEQANHQNQFLEINGDKNTLPQQPQELSPMNQANASLLLDIYDKEFIKKLHSKHWQFKQQALTQAYEDSKKFKGKVPKNTLRSYIFIYNKGIKQPSPPVCILTMDLISMLLPLSADNPQEFKAEAHHELEHAIQQTIYRLSDNNQKIRSQAEKTFHGMVGSSLFGVHLCFLAITKPNLDKLTIKQKKSKLQCLRYMVEKFGINADGNGVPISVADYAVKLAEDPNNEIRQLATVLLKNIRDRGGKQRLVNLMTGQNSKLKISIQKQLEK